MEGGREGGRKGRKEKEGREGERERGGKKEHEQEEEKDDKTSSTFSFRSCVVSGETSRNVTDQVPPTALGQHSGFHGTVQHQNGTNWSVY